MKRKRDNLLVMPLQHRARKRKPVLQTIADDAVYLAALTLADWQGQPVEQIVLDAVARYLRSTATGRRALHAAMRTVGGTSPTA